MGLLQEKDIRGYQIKTGIIVCPVCATAEEIKAISEDNILTEYDIDRDVDKMVCDRCKKEI